jgi:hypothetical protein
MKNSSLSSRVNDPDIAVEVKQLEEEVLRLLHRTFELMDFLEESANEVVELERQLHGKLSNDITYQKLIKKNQALEVELAMRNQGKVLRWMFCLNEKYIKIKSLMRGQK